jgi:hypothetical protein
MAKLLSGRVRSFNVGVTSSTENQTTFQVVGDGNFVGIVTAISFYGDGSNLTGISAGIGTEDSVNTTGIITASSFYGDGSNLSGISAVARVTVSQTAPSSPSEGDLWYHSTQARLFVYYTDINSSQWVDAAPFNLEQGGGSGTSVSVGATAPVGPLSGDLWYNSNYGRLFVYYRDGDSDQWVDAAPFNMAGLTTSTTYTENSFLATAGQTTFSVIYDVGYVEVYLNGIRLSSSEYTATTGNSIILDEPAVEGDVVDIIEVVTNRGPTGPQGDPGPLSGVGTTSTSTTHYPIIVKGSGDQDAFITTTSNYFSFIPESGTLSVNQINVGVTTLGITTATDLTVQTINCSGVATATDFNSTSDVNLKKNIKTIDDPLEKVMQLKGVSFDWKHIEESSAGVIAQDVEKVLPEIVRDAEDGHKSLNYNGLIGLLIEAVKEQNETIKSLEQKINTLEERLN